MEPISTAIAAIGSFASTAAPFVGTAASLYGAYSQYEAGEEAEKEAKLRYRQEMFDEANRSRAEMAERRARLAASGVQSTGSPALFMDQAKKMDDTRLNWMRRTGKARAESLASQGRAGAVGELASIPGYWI